MDNENRLIFSQFLSLKLRKPRGILWIANPHWLTWQSYRLHNFFTGNKDWRVIRHADWLWDGLDRWISGFATSEDFEKSGDRARENIKRHRDGLVPDDDTNANLLHSPKSRWASFHTDLRQITGINVQNCLMISENVKLKEFFHGWLWVNPMGLAQEY